MATRDTSKDVTHSQTTGKLSEKAKQTAASLQGVGQMPPGAGEGDTTVAQEILGNIYKLMVLDREWQIQQRDDEKKEEKDKNHVRDIRNKDILEALKSIRVQKLPERDAKGRFKKAKKPTEAKPAAKAEAKPAEKPAAKKGKPEVKETKAPAKEAKPDTKVKEQVQKESKKVEEKVSKEVDTAKKTANREAKSAKDKVDKEARDIQKKTAEEVKKPVEKPKVEPAPKPPEVKPPPISTATKVGIGAGAAALLMPTDVIAGVIDKASKTVGVSKPLMYAIAKQESGFNATAATKTSSAKGLYQFVAGTWTEMRKKYGDKYPILRQKGPEDGEANAIAGALYIKENSDILSKANIPVNATSIYASHFLGAGGAKTLFSSKKDALASEVLPSAAKANKPIFYKTDPKTKNPDLSKPKTVQEVIDTLYEKVGKYEEQYAAALNVPTTVLPENSNNTKGNQIDQTSKENIDLKKQMNKDKPAAAVINNQTNTINQQSNQPQKTASVDDRPAYLRKING